ncbi:MAG: ABC transporter substrate-binding protein [Sedimentibacter sp.]|uniref:ABC transporter substrate-binding protein n=1 Tax=Sedimentibacter sp. TaxID=1960295 RepID=UPI00298268D4|nr:ABC transporter substrate-binding protein [Sedimentibacter sp.]MDW5298580.1 ABC transporter substrate-binding protein [Sedimentibacter sp.]
MNKKFKIILSAAISIIMLFSLIACQPQAESSAPAESNPSESAPTEENKEPIRIGFFAPVTGPAAADGLSTTNSAELAVKLINEQGGVNGRLVELVKYDDALDTKQAVNIAQKLTTKDNVVAVVSGSYSGPTRVAAPIFQEAGIPMLSGYAVHPDVTKSGDFVFSQSFAGQVQGKAGAKVAIEMLGAKKVSIIAVDIDFGKELAESFTTYATANGTEVVSLDKFAMADKEFAPVITKLKEEVKPDLVYMANYYAQGAEFVRQAKNLGLDVPILGTEGIDSFQFLEIAGEDAEGVILTTNMNRDSENEATQDYIKTYTETYGIVPDMVGASVYDSFEVLFKVIADVGTDPVAMKEAINSLQNFETVTGTLIEYAPSREAIKPVQVQTVKDGEFHYYGEVKDIEIITPVQK